MCGEGRAPSSSSPCPVPFPPSPTPAHCLEVASLCLVGWNLSTVLGSAPPFPPEGEGKHHEEPRHGMCFGILAASEGQPRARRDKWYSFHMARGQCLGGNGRLSLSRGCMRSWVWLKPEWSCQEDLTGMGASTPRPEERPGFPAASVCEKTGRQHLLLVLTQGPCGRFAVGAGI